MLTKLKSLLPAVLSSIVVTGLLFGIEQVGGFEPTELKIFDLMMRSRREPTPDPRLLVVGITEQDIHKYKYPLSGQVIDNLFSKLERYQPQAIGLDIIRDQPVEPGHAKLLQHIKQNERIFVVCKLKDSTNPAVAPPSGIPPEAVGFADIVEDTDTIVRRNLLVVEPDPNSSCATPYSLGFQLALQYLQGKGIQLQETATKELRLKDTVLKRLQSNSGGYQNIDANGYQILLNYRSAHHVAKQVSLTQILSDQVKPDFIKDRVILIGQTAASVKDAFNTPYSAAEQDNPQMPGVVLHAHMVSQILSAVLDHQPLFWYWPQWGEVLWSWGWCLVGGLLAWRFQHPLRLGLLGGTALLVLIGGNFILFSQAAWVPIIPPLLGLVITGVSVIAYTAFKKNQEQEEWQRRVQEQQETISLLEALLKEGGGSPTDGTVLADKPKEDAVLHGRYKVARQLASGGFGSTYVALDTGLPGKPECVVKHLQPARQDARFLEVARRLFRTEAEILELLGQHSQIPQLLAYFEQNQQFYLVQEYIKGHPLSDEFLLGQPLEERQVLDLLKDVLETLSFVHKHQVIHRDIKPGNIIRREEDNRLVLIDFGAVKQIQPQQAEDDSQTVAIGTAGYAPPEQLMGQPRLNSDIYALGMIGIQALTGKAAREIQRDSNTGLLIWRHFAEPREELAAILERMTEFDARTRYQSTTEVLESLANLKL